MMENYRNDVIVIFAGYPDKMERFLEKNEGLRSRIAFHVYFPDYNAEELCDILKLMSREKGYILDKEAEKKCRVIRRIRQRQICSQRVGAGDHQAVVAHCQRTQK